MSTTKPYYRRRRPRNSLGESDLRADGSYVDFSRIRFPGFASANGVALANDELDNRGAAVIAASAGLGVVDETGQPKLRSGSPIVWDSGDDDAMPKDPFTDYDLSEVKRYAERKAHHLLLSKCLPVMAYQDYFPDTPHTFIRSLVSTTISTTSTGYCGSLGFDADGTFDLIDEPDEGNYDMNQQRLIPIAYGYFEELTPHAREHLIATSLGGGRIHRFNRPELRTSGRLPNDWARAGYISPLGAHKNIGETENHILMMLTTRYLTNQLLFQRDHDEAHDNRRNDGEDFPSTLSLVLDLLKRILRGDFSEYNAKTYQAETRWALLNLCSYSYDHEVRLAARMVLDYLSAKVAVSSNDLRRLLPFRRRNEGANSAHGGDGFMKVSLIAEEGADPMSGYFAVQAGNLRSTVVKQPGQPSVHGIPGAQNDLALEVLTDYRLPPSIHDLLVNDGHRRFFQRLHRTPRDEVGGARNADNMEIHASSPSYLITAGGGPAGYAIDPRFAGIVIGDQDKQLGVAVTTSFIPTTRFGASDELIDRATQVIQLGTFSALMPPTDDDEASALNYGVAPDFACGHQIFLPSWTGVARNTPGWSFVNRGSVSVEGVRGPGFFLAIYQQDWMACLEVLDTWLHPEVTFEQFRNGVPARNPGLQLFSGQTVPYTTTNGTKFNFVVWRNSERAESHYGASVFSLTYGSDPADAFGDAGSTPNHLLNGTILNSGPAAVVTVNNPYLGQHIKLDLSDLWKPRRTAEDGTVESAGSREEIWADFDWAGPREGDVCRPYATVAGAQAAVAGGGTVRMIPSVSAERVPMGIGKKFRMVAPIGGVTIG